MKYTITNSTIIDSSVREDKVSQIDLVILGIVIEKPQSAYDIQKDVEYHHLSRWVKISIPSIYRKVLQLSEKGYLESNILKGDKYADKAIYSITDKGREYFNELMAYYSSQPVPMLFDFNVVISNLNKVDKAEATALISSLRKSLKASIESSGKYVDEYKDIPLVGRTIIEQQKMLYTSLLKWLDSFEEQFDKES